MKPGYYWWFNYSVKTWYIVLVVQSTYGTSVLYPGTDIDTSLDEARRDGEFGPKIPRRRKRVGQLTRPTVSESMGNKRHEDGKDLATGAASEV